MKKLVYIICACFCLSCSLLNQPADIYKEKHPKLYTWIDNLCSESFMGRKTASLGDSLAFCYIGQTISNFGYEYKVQRFTSKSGYLLRNIIVSIPGADDSLFVIGSHYDGAVETTTAHHFPAANDNASGVIHNLAVLDTLRSLSITTNHTILCCFWDGEEVFDGSCFAGSRYFVNNFIEKDKIVCYLNFDTIGHEHELFVKHDGKRTVSLLNSILHNGRFDYVNIDMSISDYLRNTDFVPFSDNGIPYIGFGDPDGDSCKYRIHSPYDVPSVVSLERIHNVMLNTIDIICNN